MRLCRDGNSLLNDSILMSWHLHRTLKKLLFREEFDCKGIGDLIRRMSTTCQKFAGFMNSLRGVVECSRFRQIVAINSARFDRRKNETRNQFSVINIETFITHFYAVVADSVQVILSCSAENLFWLNQLELFSINSSFFISCDSEKCGLDEINLPTWMFWDFKAFESGLNRKCFAY